jgi:predicted RNase H-like HicB family nuclease
LAPGPTPHIHGLFAAALRGGTGKHMESAMKNRYTATVVREKKLFMAICPEVPEANGQRKTREACLADLAAAIETVLDYKRE